MSRKNRANHGRSRSGNGSNSSNRALPSALTDIARERPFTAAMAAAATVGAGVFLWSRRGQIGEQIGTLSDQIAEWRETMLSDEGAFEESEFDQSGDQPFMAAPVAKTGKKSVKHAQRDIAAEALTLKQAGQTKTRPADPLVEQQSKVGAIAY